MHGGVRGRGLITPSYSIGIAIRIVIPIDHLQVFVPSVLFYDCLFQLYHFGVGFIISSPGQLAFR